MKKIVLSELDLKREAELKTLTLDFDGPVHAYSKGWYDGTIYDDPTEGMEEALKLLSSKFELVLQSSRVHEDGKEEVIAWLKKNNLLKYFKEVTDRKVPSVRYIDDLGVRFENWQQVIGELREDGLL